MREPSGFKPTMRSASGVRPVSAGICIPHFGSERGYDILHRFDLGVGVSGYFEGCVGELL
jgi:hypothetical protein